MTTRPMIRTLLGLAAFAALALAVPAAAQTASATFQVSANVLKNCTVSAGDVVIGAYDPVVANDTADATGTGTVTVRCTKNTLYNVGLNDGSHVGRRMQVGASGDFLSYELYSDSGYTSVWGATGTARVTRTASSSAAFAHTVYARVPAGQDVDQGAYTDTVTATIEF